MQNQYLPKLRVLLLFSTYNELYTDSIIQNNGGKVMNVTLSEPDRKQQSNLMRLERIAMLKDNWDGYGAEHFSEQLIHRADNLIRRLYIQPEIFPTADGSIQIEYEKDNGDYLEFQFTGNGSCEGFMLKNGSEEYFHSQDNYRSINAHVADFYGQ